MPIFEYRCRSCDCHFELLVRGSVAVACPSCGTSSVERMLSMFSVSSPDTARRNSQNIGAENRRKAQAVEKESQFYKTDHHDD